MALSLGSSVASKVYLGATEVALAYLGATQVYTSSAFSAEAQNYFDRLDTAGDTTYVDYKQPLANYIDSLVALGGAYWDTMLSSASFVGVGIQGITVPLRDGMTVPTQNNFVASDLNQLTGLKGDASTKVLEANLLSNDIAQNDGSLSVYQTEAVTSGNYTAGSGFNGGIGGGVFIRDLGSTIQCAVHGGLVSNGTGWVSGLVGGSRSSSTTQTQRTNQTDYPFSSTSLAPTTDVIRVFAAGTSPKTDPRLATYHVGPALNLATLEGLQDTLITEIAATFNTLVYQSDFANGATEYTPVRVTAVAPDSPDASTNVISLTPTVDTANHYIRLTTSNVNTSDTYLTKFDVFIAAGQAFDGIQVLDWIGQTKFAKTLAGSELGQWVSVSFLTTYPDYGQPAIYLTNAGSVSFVGNNSDVAYIRNLEILEQS